MNRNKSVAEALAEGKRILKESGVEQYALDAEVLLMQAAGLSKVELFTKDNALLSGKEYEDYMNFLQKRKKRVPVQYITGQCEFMALPFFVGEGVLIPRPDTEILVETVLEFQKEYGFGKILDMCTGSGCISVSLAKYAETKIVACDVSPRALAAAKKNAVLNGVEERLSFLESDLFKSFPGSCLNSFDAIVSNPPYIRTEVIGTLMREVKEYEPGLALDGGEDGLRFYRRIVVECKSFLKAGGFLFFEIGFDQGAAVKLLLEEAGFEETEIRKDLAGLDRVVLGRRKVL